MGIMIKSFSTSSKFLRPDVSRLEDSLKFSADFLEELKILQLSWEPFFSWEPVAYRKHCFPLLPALPWKREVKVGEKVRASMTNRAGTASSSTWTSANELASRKKDKHGFSYCFTPRCLQSQSDAASCLRTTYEIKLWVLEVQALTPRPYTTRELTLGSIKLWQLTQRKPLDYKTWYHTTTSGNLCKMPHSNNKQNKNPNPLINRQGYHLSHPWPSERKNKQTNKTKWRQKQQQ